ncbi:lytic transglycosylase domain-containing protein [Mitsuaria sp. CC2]|uniref:lytic transglycosylase domain-containing protein n=1 Tax=Mitsuaria sp. CC2 TaxID=3029186 RepID=UPI003B8DFEF1
MTRARAAWTLALALAGAEVPQAPALAAPAQTPPRVGPASRAEPADRPDMTRFDRCFLLAGERYGVSPLLLKAVARQESGLDPAASNRNANGSTDTGLMQINSSWLPILARYGVNASDLRVPCVNILVGAWILGSNFRSMGTTADALGAYNARDPAKRLAYARQVLRHYATLNATLNATVSARLSAPRPAGPAPGSARQIR